METFMIYLTAISLFTNIMMFILMLLPRVDVNNPLTYEILPSNIF
jgi:hypothetical protein